MEVTARGGREVEHIVVSRLMRQHVGGGHSAEHIPLHGNIVDDGLRLVVGIEVERVGEVHRLGGHLPLSVGGTRPELQGGAAAHKGPFASPRSGHPLPQGVGSGIESAVHPSEMAAGEGALDGDIAFADGGMSEEGLSAHHQVAHQPEVAVKVKRSERIIVVWGEPVGE